MALPSMKSPLYTAPKTHPYNVVHLDSGDSRVTRSGSWVEVTDIAAMGMSYFQSKNVGDYQEFKFCGTGLWMYVYRSSDSGMLDVYIDDALIRTLDLYKTAAERDIVWAAVGLKKIDDNGELIEHTCKLAVATKNPLSSDNYVKIDGFEIELEDGALQVLAFLEQTVPTVAGPSPPSGKVLIEADAAEGVSTTGSYPLYSTVAANTDFISKSVLLPSTQNVLIAVVVKTSPDMTVYLLRDGAQIASLYVTSGVATILPFLDLDVAAGTRTYSIRFSVNATAYAGMVIVSQTAVEGDVEKGGTTSVSVSYNYTGIIPTSAPGHPCISKSITLNVLGDIWVLATVEAYIGQGPAAVATWRLYRGTTYLQDITSITGSGSRLAFLLYHDAGLAAGTYTYTIYVIDNYPGEGAIEQCSLIEISDGG